MKLSVLIVSYRVRFFLEHCLLSVMAAAAEMELDEPGWQTEVLVIDNDSGDDSISFLRTRFPTVEFVHSAENLGFGRANNLLLAKARGEYILFLNPDTIVPEKYLLQHIRFLESDEKGGASGVRMIDGAGHYLPESKRGYPNTWASFCKMAGLTSAFPGSKLFAPYYLGQLSPNEDHLVDILSGACMLVKKSVLDITGSFDEQFFMYGEDIDLSYRISKSGYSNWYFAEISILHFKGESTRKDHKYQQQFYMAMKQFVRKHFTATGKFFLLPMLDLAIRLRTSMAKKNENKQTSRSEIAPSPNTYLRGDADSIAACKAKFPQPKLTADVAAEQVIFCIGESFGYTALLAEMEDNAGRNMKIFHPAAAAIIGSSSKTKQGSVELSSEPVPTA